ncbi:MAG: phosphatidylglycerophosphatase A family protein [Casimicrobium sp.]
MSENIANVAATVAKREPSFRMLLSHPAHFFSFGFGSGLVPFAPGTFGTLAGWAIARWLHPLMGDMWFFTALALALAFGLWAAQVTTDALGVADHGAIVSDELIAIAFIVGMLPGSFWQQLLAFIVFRILDIRKPGPIGWADRNLRGAYGVMLDDVIAAFITVLLFAVCVKVFA